MIHAACPVMRSNCTSIRIKEKNVPQRIYLAICMVSDDVLGRLQSLTQRP
jgi:predicted metal-binding protein